MLARDFENMIDTYVDKYRKKVLEILNVVNSAEKIEDELFLE